MGNICSRSSNPPDAFSQPGRVLGSSPEQQTAAPCAPLPTRAHWQTPGRTLGESESAVPGQAAETTSSDDADARSKAALAAQKRAQDAKSASGKGKLGAKLAAQKAQTQAQTLNEASRDERATRDSDDAATARRWE